MSRHGYSGFTAARGCEALHAAHVCRLALQQQQQPSPHPAADAVWGHTWRPVSLHSASGSFLMLLAPTSNSVKAVRAPISGGREPRSLRASSSCCSPCRSWTACGRKVMLLLDRLSEVRLVN